MEKNVFLGRDPKIPFIWKEWEIQSYVVMELRRMGYIVHGDQNGASKTPRGIAQAKVTGALAGWPDLTILPPNLPVQFVELKLAGGRPSKEQTALHAQMRAMEHNIEIVYAESPVDALEQICKFLPIPSPTTGN